VYPYSPFLRLPNLIGLVYRSPHGFLSPYLSVSQSSHSVFSLQAFSSGSYGRWSEFIGAFPLVRFPTPSPHASRGLFPRFPYWKKVFPVPSHSSTDHVLLSFFIPVCCPFLLPLILTFPLPLLLKSLRTVTSFSAQRTSQGLPFIDFSPGSSLSRTCCDPLFFFSGSCLYKSSVKCVLNRVLDSAPPSDTRSNPPPPYSSPMS